MKDFDHLAKVNIHEVNLLVWIAKTNIRENQIFWSLILGNSTNKKVPRVCASLVLELFYDTQIWVHNSSVLQDDLHKTLNWLFSFSIKDIIIREKLFIFEHVQWLHYFNLLLLTKDLDHTAQKIKFFIKDFFSKCNQIRSLLRIWSHLLKKFLMENFIFCAVRSLY